MSDDLAPFVVVAMADVPDGRMPRNATVLVRRCLDMGLRVRSTYAVAMVPGVLRKVRGFTRGVGGEGDAAKGGSMERVTVTRESVAVRVWEPVTRWASYLIWHSDDGAAWSMEEAKVRWPGEFPRPVTWEGRYIRSVMSDIGTIQTDGGYNP